MKLLKFFDSIQSNEKKKKMNDRLVVKTLIIRLCNYNNSSRVMINLLNINI